MTRSGWLDQTSRLYLDSNIVIYYVQGNDDRQKQVDGLLADALSCDIELFANEIVVCECLYGAYRLGRPEVEEAYRTLFFESGLVTVVPADFVCLMRQRASALPGASSYSMPATTALRSSSAASAC